MRTSRTPPASVLGAWNSWSGHAFRSESTRDPIPAQPSRGRRMGDDEVSAGGDDDVSGGGDKDLAIGGLKISHIAEDVMPRGQYSAFRPSYSSAEILCLRIDGDRDSDFDIQK